MLKISFGLLNTNILSRRCVYDYKINKLPWNKISEDKLSLYILSFHQTYGCAVCIYMDPI